jgi:hypothetical protein
MGTKCGRRERESRREGAGGAILRRQELLNRVPSRVVAAKGIPVFSKAARFAVRRWNGGLGRLVIGTSGSSAGIERAGDSGCPKEAQEGNDVVLRHISVGTGRRHGTPSHADRDASFTRSFDPCSLILTMHRRGNSAVVGRS